VLYLALLLHDVGKARMWIITPKPASRWPARSPNACILARNETAQLLFLVRITSSCRCSRNAGTLMTGDDRCRGPHREERSQSQHAYVADVRRRRRDKHKTWTEWKQALLWELYRRTRHSLSGAERARDILSRRIEQLYGEVSTGLRTSCRSRKSIRTSS